MVFHFRGPDLLYNTGRRKDPQKALHLNIQYILFSLKKGLDMKDKKDKIIWVFGPPEEEMENFIKIKENIHAGMFNFIFFI